MLVMRRSTPPAWLLGLFAVLTCTGSRPLMNELLKKGGGTPAEARAVVKGKGAGRAP